MGRRHSEATDMSGTETSEFPASVPVPDTAHANTEPPATGDETGDGTAETGRVIRTFTADEAYRRIANILKRTPKESREKILTAAQAVAALG